MTAKYGLSLAGFWRLARLREREGHLPALRQLAEALILRVCYGVGPAYYQMAAFWERSVPWHAKTRNLSVARYREMLTQLNPVNYRKLSQNKLVEKAILTLLHIPTPEYLGCYRKVAGRTRRGEPLVDADSLRDFLDRHPDLDKVCFKSLEGWGGHGFELIEIHRNDGKTTVSRARTHEPTSIGEFCSGVLDQREHADGWVVERFLVQHEVLSKLNPTSVNTLRLWIRQNDDSTATVLLGFLRIGRSGAIVDNAGSGGMVTPVDLQSGVLRPAMNYSPERPTFSVHPDHGARIEGIRLPFFDDALALARSCVIAFPHIRFAGVDVAIAPDGPKMIELNVSPDLTNAAVVGFPSKGLLETH
jgi:hypothetical protein